MRCRHIVKLLLSISTGMGELRNVGTFLIILCLPDDERSQLCQLLKTILRHVTDVVAGHVQKLQTIQTLRIDPNVCMQN